MTEPQDSPTQPSPPPRLILSAIKAIMEDVRSVPKSGEMRQGTHLNAKIQYKFQRFDDLVVALGAAFRAHDVALQGVIVAVDYHTWDKRNKDGGTTLWTSCRLRKRFVFTSLADGSMFDIEAAGEGSDSSDKATGKAETMALKKALTQAFLIAVADDADPDTDRPEITGQAVARNAPQNQPAPDTASDVWRALELATQQSPEQNPEQSRTANALRAMDGVQRSRTVGDLARVARWTLQVGAQNVLVDGQVLAARLLAVRGTLPPGEATNMAQQTNPPRQQAQQQEPPPDHGGY